MVMDEDKATRDMRVGLCCEYCSDSKFPCVFMEKQMRGEMKRNPVRQIKKRILNVVGKDA